CNLAAAVIAVRLSRAPLPAPPAAAPLAHGRTRVRILRILSAAFVAGGAFLALEVVAFRLLLLYLDGTTRVFAVMLATALAGIAVGGYAAAMLARRGRLGEGAARLAAAAAAACVVLGYVALAGTAQALQPFAPGSAFVALVLCATLLGPTAVLSGFLFTALGARLRAGLADAGAATGALTLANTAGAMLGSLVAAFALLPLAGMERTFFGIALAYGALACLAPPGLGRWRLAPLAAPVLALALFPFGRMAAETDRWVEARFGGRLVAEREGVELTAFYLRQDFLGEPLFYRLAANSVSMASTAVGVQRYMKLFAWLPAALHPKIESALVLCFGVGNTARAVADLPEVRRIDVVDTSRAILALSDVVFPDPARHPLRDPRARVHVEDARFFLQAGGPRYDLITGEPPPPKIAGVAFLYTREYFGLVKSRLNPGGIATYWLPAYLLLQDESLAIIRAFCDAFEDCSLWSGINRDWILMGSNGGIAPVSREHFSRLWAAPRVGDELRRLGLASPLQLAGQFMADAASLRRLTSGVPPLDDDHPRRVRSALYSEPATFAYTWLMDASNGRRRLLGSEWAKILPAEVVADSRPQFLLREMLEQAYNPDLRRAGYNPWSDVAFVIRETDLVELPRWLLGSGARVAEIARWTGWANPLAAEHLAIDAVARRLAPPPIDHARFAAMTARGQWATAFHQCLAGDRARANEMLGWLRERDPGLLAWAARACAPP
ncbi:MAG: spermidine synthase, partial [Burkholderiales bacterium]